MENPDYPDYLDFHSIVCRSGWGTCNGSHETAAEVKDCYRRAHTPGGWPCSWLVEVALRTGDPDEPYYKGIVECGLLTLPVEKTGGYECEGGHDFIPPQYLAEHGMAYASDDFEAKALAKAGVLPLAMRGGAYPL